MLLELRYCKLLTSGRILSINLRENLVLVGWLTGLFTFPTLLGNLFLGPQLLKFSDRKNIKVVLLQMSLLINLGEQIHRLIHLFALSFQLKLVQPCFCALTCGLARRVIAVLIVGQHIF